MNETLPTFGPERYGSVLHINEVIAYDRTRPVVVDCETDEKDGFVGIGLTFDGVWIQYYTDLSLVKSILEECPLVGHNLKFDIKQLIGWGIKIKPEQMYADTILMSYVQNTTKLTHGLKDLAKEYLGLEWPSYKEMVGSGKTKTTLDKQPVERVAAYCGMDVLANYRLHEFLKKKLTPKEKRYLETIELPTARVLLEMELKGVGVDVEYLKELDKNFEAQLYELQKKVQIQVEASGILRHWDEQEGEWVWESNCCHCEDGDFKFVPKGKITRHTEEFNINSNRQVAELLTAQGAQLPKTPKGSLKVDKATLEQWKHLPAVPLLLEYNKIEKLKSTYTEALLEKQINGRIYANFNQLTRDVHGTSVGISTGRLSSSNPNLQNIPARSEEGKLIRQAFVAQGDKIYIDADYSQIEPRLVAHFTKDPLFTRAFLEGKDIYSQLVQGTGRSRQDGKTFMLALLYGAQPKKLASVFKCSEKDAERIIKSIMGKLPGVTAWIERTKYEAHQKKGVWTLFKRWIPLPLINSANKYERMHWERVAVNSVVQGSAAEIMKLALVKLKEAGHSTVLTVHDEFLIETDSHGADYDAEGVKKILESVVSLDVPLLAEVGLGVNWGAAK